VDGRNDLLCVERDVKLYSLTQVDGLWTTKSEGVGLIDRVISFQDFQPM